LIDKVRFNQSFKFRKELERKKLLEEERKINLKRIDAEIKEQTLRSAVLSDSVKEFEGKIFILSDPGFSICYFNDQGSCEKFKKTSK
jgi:hypothetical protein